MKEKCNIHPFTQICLHTSPYCLVSPGLCSYFGATPALVQWILTPPDYSAIISAMTPLSNHEFSYKYCIIFLFFF